MDRNQQWQDAAQSTGRHFQSMAEVTLRGTALLWDLQLETARNLWRTQARTAALFGLPDCSELFNVGDDRARRLFSASAEQVLNSARQARETVVEMQRQLGRIAEQRTIGITDEVRDQIEQMGRHTEQGLQEIKQMAASDADQAEGSAQQAANRSDDAGRQNEQAMAQRSEADEAAAEPNAANEGRTKRETRRHEERARARR